MRVKQNVPLGEKKKQIIRKQQKGRKKENLSIMFDTMSIGQELAISYHKSTAIGEDAD